MKCKICEMTCATRESRLEVNEATGLKYLVVYYDKHQADWNICINNALNRHKLRAGECPVLCLPQGVV